MKIDELKKILLKCDCNLHIYIIPIYDEIYDKNISVETVFPRFAIATLDHNYINLSIGEDNSIMRLNLNDVNDNNCKLLFFLQNNKDEAEAHAVKFLYKHLIALREQAENFNKKYNLDARFERLKTTYPEVFIG